MQRIGAEPAHFAGLSLIGNQVRILDSPAAVSRKNSITGTLFKVTESKAMDLGRQHGDGDKSEDLPFNEIFNSLRGIGIGEHIINYIVWQIIHYFVLFLPINLND